MWELYKLLGKGFGKNYLIDEVAEILGNTSAPSLKKSLQILYGENVAIINSLEVGLMFIKGLKDNNFFVFQELVEKLNGSR